MAKIPKIPWLIVLVVFWAFTPCRNASSSGRTSSQGKAYSLLAAKSWVGTADADLGGPASATFHGRKANLNYNDNSVSGHLHVMFHFGKLTKHDKYQSEWDGTATWTGSYHSRVVEQAGGKVFETINRKGSGGQTVHAAFILTFPEQMDGSPSKRGCWSLEFPAGDDEAPTFHLHGSAVQLYGGTRPVTGSMDVPGADAIDHLEGDIPADGMVSGSWSTRVSWVAMATPVEPPSCHVDTDESTGSVAMDAQLKQMLAQQKQLIRNATRQTQQETDAKLPKLVLHWHFSPAKSDLYVDIYRHGSRVTGKTIDAVVGEEISLTGRAAIQGRPITDRHWKLGGEPIKNWNVKVVRNEKNKAIKSSAHVENLDSADFAKPSINFYWWKPGTYRVKYTVHSGGKAYSAHSIFVVFRPEIKLTATTLAGLSGVLQIVQYEKNDPYVGNLAYVGNNGHGHTIIFDRSAIPARYPGTTEFVQLIKEDGHAYLEKWHPDYCIAEHDKGYLLDTNYPFNTDDNGNLLPNAAEVYDTPGMDIFTWTHDVNISMKFKTYLLYKSNKPQSIFVPISYVPWWWQGKFHYDKSLHRKLKDGEVRHPKYLVQTSESVTRSESPPTVQATAYPVWDRITPNPMHDCDAADERTMNKDR